MSDIEKMKTKLQKKSYTWLITGVAGFIGSNILEALLRLNQHVIGLDNFMTGCQQNLDEALDAVSPAQRKLFVFMPGDIRDPSDCAKAMKQVDFVLHQAALGSVPRSIKDPSLTHAINVDGFLNVLIAAKAEKVKRFVYASSSSVYGDSEELPKVESRIGLPLSPYAVSKYTNELYACVFGDCYRMETIGLRYFNVFGPRQDSASPYAAVIPLWFSALLSGESPIIYGDGETSRDFCYVDNVVQANMLAAMTCAAKACNQVYNIAVGDRTTLNQLIDWIRQALGQCTIQPCYCDFRAGDIRHSLANIDKAKRLLGYHPQWKVAEGLQKAKDYYSKRCGKNE